MRTLIQDVRYALRLVRRTPGVTAVAVCSLALGIGPNAAIFGVIDAIGLRALPIRDPAGLIRIYTGRPEALHGRSSLADYLDIREGNHHFSDVAAWVINGAGVATPGGPAELAIVATVSDNFFSALGIRAAYGRLFLPDEARLGGGARVVVLSDAYWARRFDRAPRALGRALSVNGVNHAIVGVLPAAFRGIDVVSVPDFWTPLNDQAGAGRRGRQGPRDDRFLHMIARLRNGATLEQAQAEMDVLARHLGEAYVATNRDRRVTIEYEWRARRNRVALAAVALLALPALVLLTACANVAGLLLARAEARRQEIALRRALGAGGWRLVRQLLTESGLLALAAVLVGLVLGWWILLALPRLIPQTGIPLGLAFRFDVRVVAFAFLVTLVAAPVFGLAPAIVASRSALHPLLKGEPMQAARARRFTLRNALVVTQIAASLLLLVLSGLLVRSFLNSNAIDTGFERRPMVFGSVAPGVAGYDGARSRQFYRELRDRLRARPAVADAALASYIPLNSLYGSGRPLRVEIPGREVPLGRDAPRIFYDSVDERYFEVMGTRILRGRPFTAAEGWPGPGVVLVNQTFAKQYWPGEDPIGRRIILPDRARKEQQACEVVGVVQDGKYMMLGEQPMPYMYLPMDQQPREMTVIVRPRGDEAAAITEFRRTLTELNPVVPSTHLITMREHMQLALIVERLAAIFVGTLGSLGLVLSIVGLYGVIAYLVSRRTREIGIRMALGARPSDVLRQVVRQGGGYAAVGIGIGLALTLAATQVMGAMLYGVSRYDPATYLVMSTLVLAVALAASYVPARRAARIDPLRALRHD
jgi:predicted permease